MEKHKLDLNNEQLNLAIDCSNKLFKCTQHSPVLDNQERLRYIKGCQETAIKCYLSLFNNVNNKKYIK